jgi:N-acetylglucosamine-6-phosphate deacetylase
MTGKTEDIATIARAHAVNGVTSLVVGISSGSMEQINASLEAIAQVVDQPVEDGATILGSYVEGKFGSLAKKWRTKRKVYYPTEL